MYANVQVYTRTMYLVQFLVCEMQNLAYQLNNVWFLLVGGNEVRQYHVLD